MSNEQAERIARAIHDAGSEVAFWIVMAAVLVSSCLQCVKH